MKQDKQTKFIVSILGDQINTLSGYVDHLVRLAYSQGYEDSRIDNGQITEFVNVETKEIYTRTYTGEFINDILSVDKGVEGLYVTHPITLFQDNPDLFKPTKIYFNNKEYEINNDK